MGADLRTEAVLEGGDDAAAVGVVLRVGAGDHVDVERQADLVAADLDVTLLHDVEEAHLDPLGQVGQLVDREDAAVGPRQEAVVDGELVAEVPSLGDLDRVDLADQVRDRDVGGGELLAVAAVAGDPQDGGAVALAVEARPARPADRRERIVVDLAAGEGGDRVVEQAHQEARHPRFGLPALAEKDDVLPAQDRVLDLGDHALVVADDAREERLGPAEARDQVIAHLLLDRLRPVALCLELADRARPHRRSSRAPRTSDSHAAMSRSSSAHTVCGMRYSRHVTW